MNPRIFNKKFSLFFTITGLILSAMFFEVVFAGIVPPPGPWDACKKAKDSPECLAYCSTKMGQGDPINCPVSPLEAECWVGQEDCESIPIPMPVIGWYPDKIPVRVASDPRANSWEGVWVWNPGGVEGKDKEGGVYVFNKEAEPMWTRCVLVEAQCKYFHELMRMEEAKVGDMLANVDLYMQNALNIWTNSCPTYAKIAGVSIISDSKDPSKPPEVKIAENIDESSCKNIIDSWDTILVDKNKAVKMSLSEALEDVPYEFFDAFMKKDLIDQINSSASFEEDPESVRPQSYLYNAIGGTFVEPNTSFLAFFRRATRPMSSAQISLLIDSYAKNEQKKAGDALLEDVRQGSGLFSKYEVSETSKLSGTKLVNSATGEEHPSRFFATYPSGVAFSDMMDVRRAALDVFVNSLYYQLEIQNQIFPQLDSGDNRYKGGPPQLNSLLNTTMSGGSGMYSGGGGGGVPQPSPKPNDATCEMTLSDASILMGLNERREYVFSVDVEKNSGNGSVNDIDKIEISLVDSSLASALPSLLRANDASGTRDFVFDLRTSKAGTTDVEIVATLKSAVGGRDCSTAFDLEVLNFERKKCSSQKCKGVLAVPDPDLTLYTCVGIPDDGNNNDCTTLNSNCKQEWCVDIGDKNGDGFDALCYDSCDASHQQSCRAAGYICQASGVLIKPQKQFGFIDPVKKVVNPLLRLLSL